MLAIVTKEIYFYDLNNDIILIEKGEIIQFDPELMIGLAHGVHFDVDKSEISAFQ